LLLEGDLVSNDITRNFAVLAAVIVSHDTALMLDVADFAD
jgi:hypothetical protein